MSETTVIEINGIKMEVDLRYAKRIDHLRIGSRVKVLVKHYNDYQVKMGVVIGFEPFTVLPTIIVAYVDVTYSAAQMNFIYYNAQSKDVEVVAATDEDELALSKDDIMKAFDRDLAKLERQKHEIIEKREFFLSQFGAYWEKVSGIGERQGDVQV